MCLGRAELIALHATVEHLLQLLDLDLNLLAVWVEGQCLIHALYSLGIVLDGFVQESDVVEHIDLVLFLLRHLRLVQGFLEVAECLVDLAHVLRHQNAHIVVREERILVHVEGRLVALLRFVLPFHAFLDDANVVEESNFIAKSVLK